MAVRHAAVAKPFRFFELPAELRDAIYDLLPCRRRIIQSADDDCAYSVSYLDLPMPHLTLVNKQFKHEYTARARKRKPLYIEDNRDDAPGIFDLEPEATQASAVVCELSCLHVNAYDLPHHVEMLQDLAPRMKNCAAIEVRICFEAEGNAGRLSGGQLLEKHESFLNELAKIANLKILELYVHARGLPKAPEWRTGRKLVARYEGSGSWRELDVPEGGK